MSRWACDVIIQRHSQVFIILCALTVKPSTAAFLSCHPISIPQYTRHVISIKGCSSLWPTQPNENRVGPTNNPKAQVRRPRMMPWVTLRSTLPVVAWKGLPARADSRAWCLTLLCSDKLLLVLYLLLHVYHVSSQCTDSLHFCHVLWPFMSQNN